MKAGLPPRHRTRLLLVTSPHRSRFITVCSSRFLHLINPLSKPPRRSSAVKSRPGSLLIYEQRLVARRHGEGTSMTKTCAFHKVLLISTTLNGRNVQKWGFSNNLRKLTKNFIYNAETIVYRRKNFVCVSL